MTPDGTLSLFATGLQGASGNEFDANGNLFQSNIAAGLISKIDPGGNVTSFNAGHSAPVGIAIDGNGNLYIANCGNNSIRKITPDGLFNTLFSFGTMFACPNGMIVGDDGFLYVANFNNGWVVRVNLNSGLPASNATNFAFIPGNGNGHITTSNGDLYVAGRASHRIYKLTLGGDVTPIAGSGIQGDLDGPALQARFSFPNGIAPSPDGQYLYVNTKTDNASGTLNPVKLKRIELNTPVQTLESTMGRLKAMYR